MTQCAHAGLAWTVTALALYSSVKQYYSKLIMLDGPLRLKNSAQAADIFRGDMANNSASTYRSYSVRILSVCPFSHAVQFFPCGWVPRKMR